MSKTARYFPIVILLMIGAGLCVSLLLVVNNSSFSPVATQTPIVIYVPVYPTIAPTPARLPDQCDTTGGMYQVQFFDPPAEANIEPLPSPDGRATVYARDGKLYVRHPGGETLLWDRGFAPPLSTYMAWSPDSQHLAYILRWPFTPLKVADSEGRNVRDIAIIEYPASFLGWSPDGRYLALQESFLSDLSVWTPVGERGHTNTGRDLYIGRPPTWSLDGNWLAYVWRDNTGLDKGGSSNPYGMTIAAADGSASVDVVLSGLDAPDEPIRHIIAWSPDSRSIAVTYLQYANDQYQETVRVYDTVGDLLDANVSLIESTLALNLHLWNEDWPGIHWLSNDRLAYSLPVADGQFDLLLFDLDKQTSETIYEGLPKLPFYPARGGGAVYIGQERPFSIDLLVEDEARLPFIQNASDAGDPDWSPNGEWVAAVWATGEEQSRRLFLSWMHPDGSERHDIDADFRDVRDLRWLKESRKLAYIAWRGEQASIEIADTNTRERRTIAEGFSQIQHFTYDAKTDTLSFWWKTADGQAGKDAYRPDGERLYRITYPNDVELPDMEFWSPDGTVAAIKVAPPTYMSTPDEQLVLAYTDGRPPVIVRRNLTGLGDPLWSPDSQQLAFTQSRDFRPVSLQVVDSSGTNLWDYTPFTIYRQIAWRACE